MSLHAPCSLCAQEGGEVLWSNAQLRVVHIHDELQYPGICRVIWNAHIGEFSDLELTQSDSLMHVVATVERSMRAILQPVKVNVASLGNYVPHLHWHLIPRYLDDAHFPQPIWSAPVREVEPALLDLRRADAKKLGAHLIEALSLLEK